MFNVSIPSLVYFLKPIPKGSGALKVFSLYRFLHFLTNNLSIHKECLETCQAARVASPMLWSQYGRPYHSFYGTSKRYVTVATAHGTCPLELTVRVPTFRTAVPALLLFSSIFLLKKASHQITHGGIKKTASTCDAK